MPITYSATCLFRAIKLMKELYSRRVLFHIASQLLKLHGLILSLCSAITAHAIPPNSNQDQKQSIPIFPQLGHE